MHAAELRSLAGREVRDDEARRPTRRGVGREALPAVGLEDRRVGHRHDRRLADELARLREALQALQGAHPATESALGGPLDHGAVGERIGEREAELDHIRTGVDGGGSERGRLGLADEVDDERFAHPRVESAESASARSLSPRPERQTATYSASSRSRTARA